MEPWILGILLTLSRKILKPQTWNYILHMYFVRIPWPNSSHCFYTFPNLILDRDSNSDFRQNIATSFHYIWNVPCALARVMTNKHQRIMVMNHIVSESYMKVAFISICCGIQLCFYEAQAEHFYMPTFSSQSSAILFLCYDFRSKDGMKTLHRMTALWVIITEFTIFHHFSPTSLVKIAHKPVFQIFFPSNAMCLFKSVYIND